MIKLKVSGMTCEHCENAVKQALTAVDGVETVVSVDRNQNEAVIEGGADVQTLLAAVREEGYEAVLAE